MSPTLELSPISQLRAELTANSDCEVVSADVYIDLLTSHGFLDREDIPAANLYGLLDKRTGTRMVIPAEELPSRYQIAMS